MLKAKGSEFPSEEKAQIRQVLNRERFTDQPPREVYATLLDEGTYLCSWQTMYRILDENQEVEERRDQLRDPQYARPELLATQPNQLWSWDITKLLGPMKVKLLFLEMRENFSAEALSQQLARRDMDG